MRKKIKNLIKQYKKEILTIVVFVITVILINKIFVHPHACRSPGGFSRGISSDDILELCFVVKYVGESVFAGSLLVSVILLYKLLKK